MQKRIDEIQNKYREWCHLLPQLEEDIRRWKHAVALIRDMDNFYTHEYQACHQAIEDGAELDLSTEESHTSNSRKHSTIRFLIQKLKNSYPINLEKLT